MPAGGPIAAARPSAGPPEFRLRGGLTRSAGTLTRVPIPDGAPTVRLVLATDTPLAAGTYRLGIEDADGGPVFEASVQRGDASGAPLALNVPAAHLPRGDYRLVLSMAGESGAPQTVATFPFRVIAAAAAP